MKVFIADGSPTMQRSLTVTLSQVKEAVIVGRAYDTARAASRVRSLRPDVVIVEPIMGARTSIEALTEVKKTNPEANVIVFAASSSPRVQRRCAETGVEMGLDKEVECEKMALITRGNAEQSDDRTVDR
jgi:NarL family two-component system response regulator YdfI